MHIPLKSIVTASLSIALGAGAFAGPLTTAKVRSVVNDVRLVTNGTGVRPAKIGDVVQNDIAVRTGTDSRAELVFQDDTLTRLGPDSIFSFKSGTREMSIERGTMLLQVPKGLGGAQIRTAAVTAAITGTTIMIENAPGDHFKVLVLEGSLKLSMNNRFGGTTTLTPGKMAIVGARENKISKPVTVDLEKVMKTSALIDSKKFSRPGKERSASALPSVGLIQNEIARQNADKQSAKLVATNLVIEGNGTDVIDTNETTGKKGGKSNESEGGKGNGLGVSTRDAVPGAQAAAATATRVDVAKSSVVTGKGKGAQAESTGGAEVAALVSERAAGSGIPKDDKAAKEAAKDAKDAAKQADKEAKEAAKDANDASKDAKKAAEDAAKDAKDAAKDAAKAAKDAAKEAKKKK